MAAFEDRLAIENAEDESGGMGDVGYAHVVCIGQHDAEKEPTHQNLGGQRAAYSLELGPPTAADKHHAEQSVDDAREPHDHDWVLPTEV